MFKCIGNYFLFGALITQVLGGQVLLIENKLRNNYRDFSMYTYLTDYLINSILLGS